ncbi:MAG: GH92 family glycosyl hydrolase [Frankiales bacterium]|nr:GH92 family glycosyl hydrolase [Frankiales bacterium]
MASRRVAAWLAAAAVAGGLPALPSLAASPTAARADDLTRWVNPLAGSLGAGFPTVAAGVPFGMATPGPATTTPAGDDPVNYIGYSYQDPEIRGFAVNHFSGAGVHIGGELPMMPTTRAVTSSNPADFASPFTHQSEVAQPGYYAVTLARTGTRVELTATPRVSAERYSFAAGGGNVLFDVARDNNGVQSGSIRRLDDRDVAGTVVMHGDNDQKLFWFARFDHPFSATGMWQGSSLRPGATHAAGTGPGGWVSFPATTRTVVVRVGMSYVDARGARRNLESEAPDTRSFDAIRRAATAAWERRLSAVRITTSSTAQRQTFYTALYHSMLLPEIYDDHDGRYRGFDDRVHRVGRDAHHYTDLSLWDTFRTQTPLLTLVAPDVAHDVGISMLDDATQGGGVIPQWVYGHVDTGTMGGDSGTPTLATLVADGALTGRDALRAWRLVLHQATARPPVGPRDHLVDYLRHGYIPAQDDGIAAPLTLEYAVDDAAVAALAQRFGSRRQVRDFTRRAQSWKHLMDPATHFLRPRNRDGSWASPSHVGSAGRTFSPKLSDGWQEGTGWQWLWQVPQNAPGLAAAMGGRSTALSRLDEFFGTAASSAAVPAVPVVQDQASFFGVYYIGNQYTPGNETDLQAPWLYDWLGQPWKTQRVVHAESQVFNATPYGLPGNDDAGSMSAWYVLATLGLYQAVPGMPVWQMSSPMVPAATIAPAGHVLLRLRAPGAGPTADYVAAARLGNRPVHRDWLPDLSVRRGRLLSFTLASTVTAAVRRWAARPSDEPPTIG